MFCLLAHKKRTPHNNNKKKPPPASLLGASFVYVRVDSVRPPLSLPYSGPYRVLEPGPKVFKLDMKMRISLQRMSLYQQEPVLTCQQRLLTVLPSLHARVVLFALQTDLICDLCFLLFFPRGLNFLFLSLYSVRF